MLTGRVLLIVLTGGPCAGKTSALSQLMEWLSGLGYRVVVVPESATELINSGLRPQNFNDAIFFQQVMARSICFKEDLFASAALGMRTDNSLKPVILLCDRGVMDAQAYIGRDAFMTVLSREKLDLASACDRRYAAVIHMRTAADGAEEFYTLANNSARAETPEEARALDRATEQAWHGHPRFFVVDNSSTFAGKILRTQQAVSSVLGIPSPTEYERKFLLEASGETMSIPIPFVDVEIEQYYLDGDRERIRKRTRDGVSSFFYTIKENYPKLGRIKIDRIITEQEFFELLRRRDLTRGVVRKTRTHFVWENQYFELDHFHHNDMRILEIRLTQDQQAISIPPFLPEVTDVTNDPKYYNYNIATQIAG